MLLIIVALLLSAAAAFTPALTTSTDKLAADGLRNLIQYDRTHRGWSPVLCNTWTAPARREWDTLSSFEKKSYIAAVQCLMNKPSVSGDLVPGARSRYDDFVGTHINQTLTIHGTGNFLTWHRYFTWTYEQALRNECGYEGFQPYINWGKYSDDLCHAPLFDGSDTSMSGNGAFHAGFNGTWVPSNALPFIRIPPGAGGDCVTSGPFANMTVNLGPVAPALGYVPPNPAPNGLGYNPRCLRRDISDFAASTATTDQNSTDLITQNTDIMSFQTVMQGLFAQGQLGVHTAGHFWVGGDPGGDLFASPGDPYFFLHHAQIDRTWWIWQAQDVYGRIHGENVLAGTITLNNSPPSRNTSLDDVIDVGVNDNFNGIKIRDALNTMDGPFCYKYE